MIAKNVEDVKRKIVFPGLQSLPKLWEQMKAAKDKAAQSMRNQYQEDESSSERQGLIDDLNKARIEWKCAVQRLDYVLEKDQIDYAIFSIEAAEKRYEMLIRKAKAQKLNYDAFMMFGQLERRG